MARIGRSRSAADREEESVYGRFLAPEGAQPIVRTYNVVVQAPQVPLSGATSDGSTLASPTYAGTRPRMHVDSTQVSPGIHFPCMSSSCKSLPFLYFIPVVHTVRQTFLCLAHDLPLEQTG